MTWPNFLQTAQVRAVEETDAEGRVWDEELRRAVTREAGQGVASTNAFLHRRATSLAGKGRYGSLSSSLRVPVVSSWIIAEGWVSALVVGWWLSAVGQESEINLLALPLIGILAWNVIVVLLSLWPASRKAEPDEHGWRETLLKRLAPHQPVSPAAERFQELVRDSVLLRFGFRLRAWLHIGAALLALGSISGMYARGWSKEYRAVWESTLLDEVGATKFFRVLFSPAATVTGQTVPLDQLPDMRRRASEGSKKPGDALPWIHLYAATLGLIVIVPRALLTLLELSRAKAVPVRALQSSDWQSYAQRLRSLVEGAGAPALVLTHGLARDTASQDRWRHWAYLHWRDVGRLEFDSVPLGGEAEFVNSWLPAASRVMLVFNMAATPETEVQRALVESLVKKLKGGKEPCSPLLLALDDADLRKRWAGFGDLPARLAERTTAWNEAMSDTGAVWHEIVVPAKHSRSATHPSNPS